VGPVPKDVGRKLGLAGVLGALLLLCAFAEPALASPPTWLPAVGLSSATANAQSQVVADNGSGDVEAFWTEDSGTAEGSFRSAGPGDSFAEQDVGESIGSSTPDIAEDVYGDAEGVWLESGSVYWSWRTNDVDGFGDAAPINGDTCSGHESDPKVAVDSSGDVIAAWLCSASGTEIVQAAYAAGGTAGVLNESAVVTLSTTLYSASNLEIAEDSGGDATIVWQEQDAASFQQIYYSYRAFGNSSTFGTDQQVATLPGDETEPSVTMDGSGDAAVAYVYDDSGSEDLYESDGSATALAGDTQFGDANALVTTGGVSTPEIFDDQNGDTALTWVVGGDAWAVVRPVSGAFTSGTDLGQSDPAYPPQIAITADDVPVEVWQQDATILAETADSGGAWTGSPTTLSGALQAVDPSLAVDAEGNAVAGWLQTNAGNFQVATVAGLDGTGPIINVFHMPTSGVAGRGLTYYETAYDVWPAITPLWTFGDGSTATTATAPHTFASAGNYPVNLTVTASDGNTATTTQDIDVVSPPPTVPGGLEQLSSPDDCVTSSTVGCGTLIPDGLTSTYQQVVSPDGNNLYAVGFNGGVVEFSRNASTGALTEIGCITSNSTSPNCTTNALGLSDPGSIAISPDGSDVYVATQAQESLLTFSRNASTGLLTEVNTDCYTYAVVAGCTQDAGLDLPYGVTVSPDGKNLYVTGYGGQDVAEFTRNTSTGAVSPIAGNSCISDTDNPDDCPLSSGRGLFNAIGINVSPTGNNVYVEAGGTQGDGDVAEFTRNSTTGALTPISGNACIGSTSVASLGCLTTMSALDGTEDMAMAPDGNFAYINDYYNDAVIELSRNATTGALSQVGCIGTASSPAGLCSTRSAVGIDGPLGVAISPDGENLYASGAGDSAEASFAVNAATGALTQLASPYNCITTNSSGCGANDATGLDGARRLVVSPDGKDVYVAGQDDSAVVELARTPQPAKPTSPPPRPTTTTGTEASWDSTDTASSASATVTVTAVNCSANRAGTIAGQQEGVRLFGTVTEGTNTYYPYAGIELLAYCDGKSAKYTSEFVINDQGSDTMTFKPTGLTVSPGDPLEMSVASGQDLKVTDVNTGHTASASGAAFSAVNGFDVGLGAITSNGHGAPLLSGSESDAAPFATLPGPVASSPTVFSDVDVDGAPLSRAPGLYEVHWVNSSKSTVASPSEIAGTNSFSGDVASVPTPATAKSADVAPVSGKVLIKLPGTHKFVPLTSVKKIPDGTLINATNGSVQITVELPNGTTQTGVFFDGEFLLQQAKNGQTTAALAGGNFKVCPKPPAKKKKKKKHGPLAQTARASKKHPVRRLWSNAHGTFSTKGRYGSAAVRGTEWLTQDQCDGTYIKVTRDEVQVTSFDLHNHKTLVKQGHSFLAPAPGYK
jgi:DNA-binding beta-propeller fold protein YncE